MIAVFDLDGTLIDSSTDMIEAINYCFEKHNIQLIDYNDFLPLAGKGENYVFEQSCKNANCDALLVNEIRDYYNTNYCIKTKPYVGIYDLLSHLKLNDIKLAVISNKSQSIVEKILSKLFKNINFDFIIGSSSGFPPKPNNKSLKFIKNSLSESEKICYSGDTLIDVQTARGIADNIFIVLWGYGKEKTFLDFGLKNENLFKSVLDLEKALITQNRR